MIPIISVIVPAYNVELFIDKCLESLHKQSFDKFEVIIVDDGSTDKTSLIIKSWLKKDLRFKYYYKENGGLSSARNYGLLKSNAEYVSFVDSDDFVAPDFLKTLFLISKLTNSDICQCNFKTVKSDNIFFQKDNSLCLKTINCNEALELLADPSSHLFKDYVWNKLYKRDLFVNTIFLKNTFFEDTEIMYKLLMKCDKICVINCDLYFYRQVSTSIVHSLDFKKLSDYQRIVNERYDKIMHIVNLSSLKHARKNSGLFILKKVLTNLSCLKRDNSLRLLQKEVLFFKQQHIHGLIVFIISFFRLLRFRIFFNLCRILMGLVKNG